MVNMNLEGMKYADLQKLAKSYGIKGNQKSDKLIEALKKILDIDDCKNSASSNNDQEDEGNALQEVSKCNGENVPPSNVDIYAVFSKNYQPKKRNSKNVSAENDCNKCSTLNTSNDLNSKENEIKKENKIKSTVKRKTFDSDETCAERKKDPCIVKDNQIGSVSAEIVEVEMQISAKRGRMSKDDTAKTSINQNCGEVLDGENNRDDENDLPMKKKLRSSYDKKPSNDSQIPRINSKLATKKGKIDWSKIHQKQFDKMDSIDDYQKKKEERKVQLFGSPIATSTVMKQKTNINAKTSNILPSANKIAKKTDHSAKVETTVNCSTAKNSTKNVRRSSNRLMSPSVFRPQVTSTKNMDLNFAKSTLSSTKLTFSKQATKTSTKNIDKTKTTCSESAARMAIVNDVKSSAKKFPFSPKHAATGNNTTLSSTNVHQPARNKFDLAASLEKPLTWVPYSGKVKPLATHDEEPVKYLKTKVVASLRDKELKEVKIKTRADRRVETKQSQKDRRFLEQMSRRVKK